jgi:death-on-curing protein
MNREPEPEFLTREIIDAIHEEQINTYGGLHGVRDENGLESAIAAVHNVYHYGGGHVFEVAAAYAYHLAESQAYLDGNKRTGAQAAFVFLEGCGINCAQLPDRQTYAAMIKITTREMDRSDLANYYRSMLRKQPEPPNS